MSPLTRKSKRHWGKFGSIPAATSSSPKRIFAIVSRPIPTVIEGKTMRRVLIFDNHPDTVQLILQAGVDAAADDFAARREKLISFVCGSILIAMSVGALLWALLS
jgi:hypothetical protein